jgi:hypothetical protein
MTTKLGRNHVVVDGSNIATEGRSMPSLTQLNEAVMAFLADHPGITVTVVVDATFGHRIDKSEVKEFDAAVSNNELVAPPAGAVGRGDAFVLSIANKAGATILSNDSFQEFHGDYDWLFDEGRLIGGKPVPHVGWVFVPRVPVRGPISRKATRGTTKKGDGRRGGRSEASLADAGPAKGRPASKEAFQPMPVPKSPPPRRTAAAARNAPAEPTAARTTTPVPAGGPIEAVNDLMPFLDFVERHPVGTSVNATVESYSSHGAYVQIGNVRGYVPLRLMSDPPPRSARDAMKVGDAVTVVVASFAPARRSIDCALPAMATGLVPQDSAPVLEAAAAVVATTGKRARTAPSAAGAATPRSRRGGAKEPVADTSAVAAPSTEVDPTGDAAAKPARAKKAAAKQTPAKKAASKKAATKKAPAKKAPAKKVAERTAVERPEPAPAAPVEPAATKKAPARKASAKRSVAEPAPTEAPRAEEVPAKKAAAKNATTKDATARRSPAKKAAAAPAKKAPARSTGKSSS